MSYKWDLDFLKENVPIQYYAEIMIGISEWRQLGSGLITPNIHTRAVNANDYSSLVIDPVKNIFWRNSGRGRNPQGSIIDFIMNFEDVDIAEAIRHLEEFTEKYLPSLSPDNNFELINPEYKYTKSKIQKSLELTKDVSPDFRLPYRHENNKRLYAYMIGKRQIEKEIYNYFVNSGFLYQDWRHSACFVSYDDNNVPVFACIRDTNWNERITYGVKGSSVNHAFYINNHQNTMVVTEAVVDAMAFMSILHLKGVDYKMYNYLALTGTKKIASIAYHLKNDPSIQTVILGYDNDEAGKNADVKTREMLAEMQWDGEIITLSPPYGKDYNDALIIIKENRKGGNAA